jgi:tetratricopeptide (TPR) repeat protein
MVDEDFYARLGLTPLATRHQVEQRFFHLMHRRPPPPQEERRLLERAYLVLSNPQTRRAYDTRRGYALHPGFAAGEPERARRFFQKGVERGGAGDHGEACRLFNAALALQPWSAEYRSHLGLAWFRATGDRRRALDLCRRAVEQAPDDPVCRRNLASLFREGGLTRRAEALAGGGDGEVVRRCSGGEERHHCML